MRVGLLIARVELTGDPGDPLRARLTGRLRIDRPETEYTANVAARDDLHVMFDRWLDAVMLYSDDATGDQAGDVTNPWGPDPSGSGQR